MEDLKKSEMRFRSIVETSRDGILVIDKEGRLVKSNQAYCTMSGYSPEELRQLTITDLEGQQSRGEVAERIRTILDGKRFVFETMHRKKDETLFPVEVVGVYEPENDVILSYIRDITEQKRHLKEKDALMQELNHRVKNNLMMITSLIKLKDHALGERVDLSDLSGQVEAIRIVHDTLLQTRDFTEIDFRSLVEKLLATVFSFCEKEVAVHLGMEQVVLPNRLAIPGGLIINELATNAVKYGFGNNPEPGFSVDLEKNGDGSEFILTVSNNGSPIPDNISLDNQGTLGFRLVTALTGQLQGSLEMSRKPCPVFILRFPSA